MGGNRFLVDFFEAGGRHPKGREALRHFESSFIEPLKFEEIVNDLTPKVGQKRVVVIDGHPRSGKTWSVVRAVQNIINELGLTPDEWMTSGLDSLGVFDEGEDLYQGSLKVQESIKGLASLKLVLLDDFLGTNVLRPLGKSFYERRLQRFFRWTDDNPFVKEMPTGSTLIITGRSLHLTLIDILLNVRMRMHSEGSDVTVVNHRRGLFRTFDKGEPFGTFDKNTLSDVCRLNRQYHPLSSHQDQNWLILAAPLLAFDEKNRLEDRSKSYAAHALFGEDIRALADAVKTVEKLRPSPRSPTGWKARTLKRLYVSYLVTAAPGLLFLGPDAYASLRIDEEEGRNILKDLYLYESTEEFRSGRLPNEFYMIALNEHLGQYLDLAARAFTHVVSHTKNTGDQRLKGIGLGLRGLLERGLHKRNSGSLELLLSVKNFYSLTKKFLKCTPDCLLHLEMDEAALNRTCTVEMSPGLAAAMGWALYNFFEQLEPEGIDQTVKEWFPERFKKLLVRCQPGSSDENETQEVPDLTEEVRDLVATYSTFLQWVIKLDRMPKQSGLLDSTVNLTSGCSEPIKGLLNVVLEDELVWAWSENGYRLKKLASANRILDFLNDRQSPNNGWQPEQRRLVANRMFTLSWHNSWMGNKSDPLNKKASKWVERFGDSAIEWIVADPELIDENLQYHWCHFITQRAVWMRDWCFQDDPNEFERRQTQIEEGSKNPVDNLGISRIANAVIHNRNVAPRRIRNLLLLVGTRAIRLPEWKSIGAGIEGLISDRTNNGKIVKEDVLQAIFELSRHGFLDRWAEGAKSGFPEWCLAIMKAQNRHIKAAWTSYHSELRSYTHLDLLPRSGPNGWKDVVPIHWIDEVENIS